MIGKIVPVESTRATALLEDEYSTIASRFVSFVPSALFPITLSIATVSSNTMVLLANFALALTNS